MRRFVAVSVCVMVLAVLGMAGCATGAKEKGVWMITGVDPY